ncbi:hypothetical protein IEN85_19230 [Pelagicoccus sp. NFK12]|uniref:Uncharacterized protein n=1 Tax=Pelagicoccus enzymogenes TaxID=2773457 RepID=A0A927FAS0_9BACT|nr:hypothetical protein [Pelagicoccus enzymogenes]MBD5781643.1 hypothetical protein [Pelagicoccus enzymogenes]
MPKLFEESLAKSFRDTKSVPLEQAFAKLFPGFLTYSQSGKELDLLGSDVRIHLRDRDIHVDLKFRDTDPRQWGMDDLTIELLSVAERGIRGYENQRTDYLVWVFKTTGRVVAIPFPAFKRFYQANWNFWYFWRAEKPQRTIMPNGQAFHSVHCHVPFRLFKSFALEARFDSRQGPDGLN